MMPEFYHFRLCAPITQFAGSVYICHPGLLYDPELFETYTEPMATPKPPSVPVQQLFEAMRHDSERTVVLYLRHQTEQIEPKGPNVVGASVMHWTLRRVHGQDLRYNLQSPMLTREDVLTLLALAPNMKGKLWLSPVTLFDIQHLALDDYNGPRLAEQLKLYGDGAPTHLLELLGTPLPPRV